MAEKLCCVTGHRDIPEDRIAYVEQELRREVLAAIQDGYTRFISGFAEGPIHVCGYCGGKRNTTPICFGGCHPYAGRLKTKISSSMNCCGPVTDHQNSMPGICPLLLLERNRYMAGESQRVIAVYDGRERGGTLFTMRYAHP